MAAPLPASPAIAPIAAPAAAPRAPLEELRLSAEIVDSPGKPARLLGSKPDCLTAPRMTFVTVFESCSLLCPFAG